MPRVRCHYVDCTYVEDGHCGAARVELDPDEGCLTYTHLEEVPANEDWVEEELDDVLDEEETDIEDEEEEDEEEDWSDDDDDDDHDLF